MSKEKNCFAVSSPTYAKVARRYVGGLYVMAAFGALLRLHSQGMECFTLRLHCSLRGLQPAGRYSTPGHEASAYYLCCRCSTFFCWPIGAVVYLVYRSGWRGLLTFITHAIALMATIVIAINATLYGRHFAGMLDPRYYQ